MSHRSQKNPLTPSLSPKSFAAVSTVKADVVCANESGERGPVGPLKGKKKSLPRSIFHLPLRFRESLGWGDFAIRRHLLRLVTLEFVLAFRTGHGNQREYQLLYSSDQQNTFQLLHGLADPRQLRSATSPKE